jgi:Outer membrane protein beta-barrel domain
MVRQTVIVLAVGVACLFGDNALARAKFVGVRGGANYATLTGDAVSGLDRVRRSVGGVVFMFPLSDFAIFQPEFLVSNKGASGRAIFTPAVFGIQSVSGRANLDYFEIPLLLKLTFADSSRVNPYVVGGPSLAANVSARATAEVNGGGGTEFDNEDVESVVADADIGLVAGGGVDVSAGSTLLELDVRYTAGLAGVVDNVNVDVKNSTWSITLGILFRFGR